MIRLSRNFVLRAATGALVLSTAFGAAGCATVYQERAARMGISDTELFETQRQKAVKAQDRAQNTYAFLIRSLDTFYSLTPAQAAEFGRTHTYDIQRAATQTTLAKLELNRLTKLHNQLDARRIDELALYEDEAARKAARNSIDAQRAEAQRAISVLQTRQDALVQLEKTAYAYNTEVASRLNERTLAPLAAPHERLIVELKTKMATLEAASPK